MLRGAERTIKPDLSLRLRGIAFPTTEALDALHGVLFDCFAPRPDELASDSLREALAAARKSSRVDIEDDKELMVVLAILHRPRLLTSRLFTEIYRSLVFADGGENRSIQRTALARVRDFQAAHGARSLAAYGREAAYAFIALLQESALSMHRRLASGVRAAYVRKIYDSPFGRATTGVGTQWLDSWKPDPPAHPPKLSTHLHYNRATRTIEGDLDYLVVGTGPAGSLITHELQRAGMRVAVVDSGPFFFPGTFDARNGLDFYDQQGRRATQDGAILVLGGNVVGGGGTINVDMVFPVSQSLATGRIAQWHATGQIPASVWNQTDMAQADAWVARRLGTRTVRPDEVNAHNNILLEGGRAHGLLPERYQLNTDPPGHWQHPRTNKRGPVENLLLPALSAPQRPACLIECAEVTRALIESGRCVGVELRYLPWPAREGVVSDPFNLAIEPGVPVRIRAKKVILAAGNLGTSAILLRSRISNPAIGRGFVMHPFCMVIGEFDRPVDPHVGTPSSVYAGDYLTTDPSSPKPDFLIECATVRPEIAALLSPGSPTDLLHVMANYRYHGGIGVVLIDSVRPDNRVTLDPWGRPRIHYRLGTEDKARFAYGMSEAVRIVFKAGAKRLYLTSHEPLVGGDAPHVLTHPDQAELVARQLAFVPNQTPLFAAHMMGGNKLGTRPDNSVVSPAHEVWGVRGLYVCDGSVFPASIAVNPMQAIYSVAKIFVDRHLEAAQ